MVSIATAMPAQVTRWTGMERRSFPFSKGKTQDNQKTSGAKTIHGSQLVAAKATESRHGAQPARCTVAAKITVSEHQISACSRNSTLTRRGLLAGSRGTGNVFNWLACRFNG